jgi:hypothetical protein
LIITVKRLTVNNNIKVAVMEALIINPANEEEATFLKSLVKKMKVKYTVVSDEDKEDYGLVKAMQSVKNSKVVSEESILKKLNS